MSHCFYVLILSLVFSITSSAQGKDVLLTIGDKKISKAEFEYIYKKNNSNLYNDSEKKTPTEYLNLFVNFKLKVLEAEKAKMDTSKAFINELKGYRKEAAAPYLTDIVYEDELVHELYHRMQQEVNASHILLRLDKNASTEQDAKVLVKLKQIRQEIIDGKDFDSAAIQYSEDPSVTSNKGNLGYFSAFMMVAPFENAAFNTPAGEISNPIRSNFGYHIIKVHDIRPNQGEIHVAHIMKNIPRNGEPVIKERAKAEIDRIYEQLRNGANFSEMAKKESEDKRSAVRGGEIPWFSAGRIVAEFSNAAFALKNIGDISEPIETKYGFHIIKKLDQRTVAPFEEAKEGIIAKIKKDVSRKNSSQKVFINKLKAAYNFKENLEEKNAISSLKIENKNNIPRTNLFSIDNKEFSTDKLLKYINQRNIEKGELSLFYEQWVNHEILTLEDSKLEDKHPEFRYLINEYHDGILFFNISQEKVWNYASEDSIGLQKFYNKNKGKYNWEERFKGIIVNCKDSKTREKAEDLWGAGMNNDEVAEHLNKEEKIISFTSGAWEEGNNEIVDYYVWNGKQPNNFNSSITFIRGNKIKPMPKTLEQARGLYTSDYQNHIEKAWVKKLRRKCKVKVNKKMLKKIDSV